MRTTPEAKVREYRERGWWTDRRIPDLFDAAVQAAPDQLALVDPPNRPTLLGDAARRLTFREVADLVDGFALRLQELGLGRDDVLITQLPNVVSTLRSTWPRCGWASS